MSKKLHLVLKDKYFKQILSGEKKEETREIRPKNIGKYLMLNKEDEFVGFVQYDSLVLYSGYQSGRPSLEIENIKGEEVLEFLDDEDGNPLTFMHEGEEHDYTNIIYKLGNIINKQNC